MKRQLSNTIYSLKFAMEKKDFERLKSSNGKKRNDFVANPIKYLYWALPLFCRKIKNLVGQGYFKLATIAEMIPCVLGKGAVTDTTCKKWYQAFYEGDFDLKDRDFSTKLENLKTEICSSY